MLRLHAEFENFRKRTAKEHEMLRHAGNAELMLRLLEVLDEFGIALEHMKGSEENGFIEGMKSIYEKFAGIMRQSGLEEMRTCERFDYSRHDAIGFEPGEDGKILKVVSKGYVYKGKILRHAKVIVGRKEETKN